MDNNWWNEGEISLYVDDKLLDSSDENIVHPNKPTLKASKVSDEIETIEVYVTGLITVKVSILINGENVHTDKLNFFEKILSKLLKK